MNKDLYRLAGIAVVLVAALAVAASLYRSSQEQQQAEHAADQTDVDDAVFIRPHSPRLGNASARVTVVEFLDPECESCRIMHPMVKQLLALYPEDVRLVVRYLPLHTNSIAAIGALEAARDQRRYWEMIDALFLHQPVWGSHSAPRPELIPEYAGQLGLDMDAYSRFLDEGSYLERIEIDRSDARTLGVRGTPSFFVNRRPLLRLGYEPLKSLIDEELANPSVELSR